MVYCLAHTIYSSKCFWFLPSRPFNDVIKPTHRPWQATDIVNNLKLQTCIDNWTFYPKMFVIMSECFVFILYSSCFVNDYNNHRCRINHRSISVFKRNRFYSIYQYKQQLTIELISAYYFLLPSLVRYKIGLCM